MWAPLVAEAQHTQDGLDRDMTARDHYRLLRRGDGPPVICVPTFRELGFVYAPLIDSLAPHFQVILYTPAVSADRLFGPDERADELARVLDDLGIDTAHLIGWSDAGSVVTEFARRHPQRVRSLTYLGTPAAYVMPVGLRGLSALYARSWLYRLTPNVVAALLVALLMGGKAMPTRALVPRIRSIGPVAGYLRFSILPCLRRPNTVETASPSLVVGGDQDRFVKTSHMQALADAHATTFAYIAGGDHFLPWTARDQVANIVTAFLAPERDA